MALFTLAANDALLIDYIAGSAGGYRPALPLGLASGVLSTSLASQGTPLKQINLTRTFDGDPSTAGLLPKLRLQLAGDSLPSVEGANFTLGWKLTAGLDGVRKPWVSSTDLGEKQVFLTGLTVHVEAAAGGKLKLVANTQTIEIQAFRSSSNGALRQKVEFSTSDEIGEVFVEDGKVFLDLSFMAVMAKLDAWFTPGTDMAKSLAQLKYTPENLLSTGDYHLGITGLPLAGSAGNVSSLSMIVPIVANQPPQITGSLGDLDLIEDELQILDLPAAFDPEGSTITWTASTSDSRVVASIENGQLILTPAANYNTTTPVIVTLKASDSAQAWNTKSFVVTVDADNDAGELSISGSAQQGETLVATLSDADGLPASGVSYQWQAGGVDIAGATKASLVLTQAQVGKAITVNVSYTDLQQTPESLSSAATGIVANVNDRPTGAVTIKGTATYGSTLSVSSTLADADGLGALVYQWLADGSPIAGANAPTLTLGLEQVGQTISVRVSYIDGFGTSESLVSAPTATVSRTNFAPTGTLTIDGLAEQGRTLTAISTLDDLDGMGTIAWKWYADGEAISGADKEELKLTQALVGKKISVEASYTDGVGTFEQVGSSATAAVANVNDAPTGPVTISGTLMEGQTLTASEDIADDDGMGTVSWQWLADGIAIAGATSAEFVLGQAQVGKTIGVKATYTDGGNTTESVLYSAVGSVLSKGATAGNDKILGTGDQDTLDGGSGVDTLVGGGGDDTYIVDLSENGTLRDTVTETAKTDTGDTLQLRGEFSSGKAVTLALSGKLANLEHIDASATGMSWLNLTGNAAANMLTGNDTDNILDGGQGDDTMLGGDGDDTYVVDSTGDVVIELEGEGKDLVKVADAKGASYALSAYVEDALLTNRQAYSLIGNDLGNKLTGNAAANTLYGGAGNDTLDGGRGADTLRGGTGDDTYVVDHVGDVVEDAGLDGGIDTVWSSISFSLARTGGIDLENLTLTGKAKIDGTGNDLGNILTGNAAANTLDGSAGNDTLIGGGGDDLYIVDLSDAGGLEDKIDEAAGGGTDTLRLRGSSSNDEAVNLILLPDLEHLDASLTGASKLDLTGNGAANVLTGNDAANVLYGDAGNDTLIGGAGNDTLEGGAGVDALTGGDGDDTYVVALTANGALEDKITEKSTQDKGDTLQLSGTSGKAVTLTLSAALANLEHLHASEVTASTKLNLTGNASANELTGSAGDNVLSGLAGADTLDGGAGNDTLNGGAGDDLLRGGDGSDVFLFNAALTGKGGSNVDRIEYFEAGTDRIFLDDAVFNKIGVKGKPAGVALPDFRFHQGEAATTLEHRIIYHQDSGELYYDPTGSANGTTDQVLFALIVNPTALSQSDFFIV